MIGSIMRNKQGAEYLDANIIASSSLRQNDAGATNAVNRTRLEQNRRRQNYLAPASPYGSPRPKGSDSVIPIPFTPNVSLAPQTVPHRSRLDAGRKTAQ